jgi:hypothetical protein
LRGPCFAALLAACAARTPPAPEHLTAGPWPEAEAMFRSDPRWLGGDACYSVDLGGDRILWLFGDSFVAPDESGDRKHATMVRNTIAIQHGRDPRTARMEFHWRQEGSKPLPFFANDGEHGFWPLHGVRLRDGPLLLFQTIVRDTPGQGLGFAIDGWRIVRVTNPDDDPPAWGCTVLPLPDLPYRCMMGTAVWQVQDDVYALGTSGDAPHPGFLCRFHVGDLLTQRIAPRWCGGPAQQPFHLPFCPFDRNHPVAILPEAAPECSLHFELRLGRWLHVCSRGFGATTIAVRTARTPGGPWSLPTDVFTPPESRDEHPLVYAGKAHPEVDAGADGLLVTYAANALDFGALFTQEGQRDLYWPRAVRLSFAR